MGTSNNEYPEGCSSSALQLQAPSVKSQELPAQQEYGTSVTLLITVHSILEIVAACHTALPSSTIINLDRTCYSTGF